MLAVKSLSQAIQDTAQVYRVTDDMGRESLIELPVPIEVIEEAARLPHDLFILAVEVSR